MSCKTVLRSPALNILVELPPSSHATVQIMGSEEALIESDAPGIQDHYVTITIPTGVTLEEGVSIIDGIKALVQDEAYQYCADDNWPKI